MASNQYCWKAPSEEIINRIQSLYDNGFGGRKKIAKEVGLSEGAITTLANRGLVKFWRTKSEMLSLAGRKRNISSETKKKISESRKRYLAENPDKIPYRLNHKSKGESYPERYFREWLEKENIQFKQEFRFGVYSFDFLVNDLIDLEIDGSQHYVDKRINSSDLLRDKQTEDAGFKVYRINWSEYQQLENKKSFLSDLKNWIEDTSKKFPVIDIQQLKVSDKKCSKCGKALLVGQKKFCSSKCQRSYYTISSDKIETAISMLQNGESFLSVGKHFGVSDNAIRKWLRVRNINPKQFSKRHKGL